MLGIGNLVHFIPVLTWRQLLPLALLILLLGQSTPVTAQSRSRTNIRNLASCYSDSDCDYSRTFLKCHNRVCQCTAVNHFDEEMNICLIRVGASCTVGSREQFCVAYASCEQRDISRSSYSGGVCKCRPRYWENIHGLCDTATSVKISFRQYFLSFITTSSVALINSFQFLRL